MNATTRTATPLNDRIRNANPVRRSDQRLPLHRLVSLNARNDDRRAADQILATLRRNATR